MPHDTGRLLCAMAHNNAWANHRLLNACARLSAHDFTAVRTSFFPSLCETLNHNLIVDWFYVDGLEGGTLGPVAWANRVPCRDIASLQHEQSRVDARLIGHCAALTDADLAAPVTLQRPGGQLQIEARDRLLLHLFQHQIHHRGQAHAMLAGTDVTPPPLDEFFTAGDATLRATDMADLGWADHAIWGGSVDAA